MRGVCLVICRGFSFGCFGFRGLVNDYDLEGVENFWFDFLYWIFLEVWIGEDLRSWFKVLFNVVLVIIYLK